MNRLFQPIDIASLVFIRILFGLLAFAEITGIWTYYHLYSGKFNPDNFQFPYYGFEWVRPLPEPFMSIVFLITMAAAICIMLGKWYRISTIIFAIGFAYSFLMEKALYLNHGYLFVWLSAFMIFVPANRAFSFDVAKRPEMRLKKIPYWPIFMLQFFMGVVYFYGGLAKINPDWLQAMPLKMWMNYKKNYFVIGPLISQDWFAWLMAYGGLCLDLFVVFFLMFKKTRIYALGFVIFFHITNTFIFQIGIFPWLSIALSLLYFSPSLPRQWIAKLRNRFNWIDRWANNWNNKVGQIPPAAIETAWQYQDKNRLGIKIAIFIIILFHLLYPFRHHTIPGNVAWTEEGHRFSWRMMLRSKSGAGTFKVVAPNEDEKFRIRIRNYLNKDQTRKMLTHPDMIFQFAHYLEKKLKEEKGYEDVEVYADIRVSLNGRKHQRYIDPGIDLTALEWSWWKHSEWILPFENTPLPGTKKENE